MGTLRRVGRGARTAARTATADRRTKVERLRAVPPLRPCRSEELEWLARVGDVVRPEPGAVLLDEGAPVRWVYVVLSGSAVRHGATDGGAVVEPGGFVGALELLARSPAVARVTAESELEVLALGAREFRGALDTIPSLSNAVLTATARRAVEAEDHRRRVPRAGALSSRHRRRPRAVGPTVPVATVGSVRRAARPVPAAARP